MKKVTDVMTRNPAYCVPNEPVASAAQLMKDKNVGPIPVVDNEQTRKLVGIVTDRDLAIKVVAEGRDAHTTRVEDIMSRKMVTCHPEDDLQKVLGSMSKHQLRRIPVVDGEDRIVGIVAQADVALRGGQPDHTAEVVKEISKVAAV